MSLRILHTSDLHARTDFLLDAMRTMEWDVWVDTGDFFPNRTAGNRHVEPGFQTRWTEWPALGPKLVKILRDRPLLSVAGNHDYISLAQVVRKAGGVAHDINQGPVTVEGLTFAGFSGIPWIAGVWNGETPQEGFVPRIAAVLELQPQVLLTHAPPAGVLDQDDYGESIDGYGITALTSALFYQEHTVRHHFFGHIHEQGGKILTLNNITFHNGAEHAIVHEID